MLKRLTLYLLLSLFGVGMVTTIAGMFGLFVPYLWIILLLPAYIFFKVTAYLVIVILCSWRNFSRAHNATLIILSIAWLSHLVQVFTPETGFDAVWYHLPVAELVLAAQQFVYEPTLYQSVNPLFSDAIFFLGYQMLGDVGAKIIAYVFGITLALICYQLGRLFVSRTWALLFVLSVSTFQVVTWQSASFYVDLAKTVWELSALWILLDSTLAKQSVWIGRNEHRLRFLLAGSCFGAVLATKLFAIVLIPLFLALIVMVGSRWSSKSLKNVVWFGVGASIIALPYYLFTYSQTRNAFFSLVVHADKLQEIGGNSSVVQYLFNRALMLPFSPLALFTAKDYVSPLIFLLFPIVLVKGRHHFAKQNLRALILFGIYNYVVWWFVPPLSTRYALSGFVMLLLLEVAVVEKFMAQFGHPLQKIMIPIFLVTAIVLLIPRFMVNYRSLRYLSGSQTRQEYLQQFMDESIDQHLNDWHKLPTQK